MRNYEKLTSTAEELPLLAVSHHLGRNIAALHGFGSCLLCTVLRKLKQDQLNGPPYPISYGIRGPECRTSALGVLCVCIPHSLGRSIEHIGEGSVGWGQLSHQRLLDTVLKGWTLKKKIFCPGKKSRSPWKKNILPSNKIIPQSKRGRGFHLGPWKKN